MAITFNIDQTPHFDITKSFKRDLYGEDKFIVIRDNAILLRIRGPAIEQCAVEVSVLGETSTAIRKLDPNPDFSFFLYFKEMGLGYHKLRELTNELLYRYQTIQ